MKSHEELLPDAGDEWVTVDADAAHYVDRGVATVLCDRLPAPITLVLKNPTLRDGGSLVAPDAACATSLADRGGASAKPFESEAIAAGNTRTPSPSGAREDWQSIETYDGHSPVLVSRPTAHEFFTPTTAFLDATGVWRVFRSQRGNWPLSFVPTEWMPLPAPPLATISEGT